MMVRNTDFRKAAGARPYQRKKPYVDKKNLHCDNCNKLGHSRDTCFRIHGFPDWFKDLPEQRKKNTTDNKAFTAVQDEKQVTQQMTSTESLSLMMNELLHLVKGRPQIDHGQVNYATMNEFSGMGEFAEWNCASNNVCLFASTEWNSREKAQTFTPNCQSSVIQSALPLKFWTEAILTATFLVNRDVIFHEEIFPFMKHTETVTECPLPIPIADQDMVVQNSADPTCPSPVDVHSTSLPVDDSSNPPPHIPAEILSEPPRRSTRPMSKPVWMNDFVCSSSHSVNVITHVAPSHSAFVASLSHLEEPKTYTQARQHSDWREAMSAELQALETNHMWELVPLPSGKMAIGCRWVFKLKLKADGSVDRHKVRLVSKGYNQVEGIDYNESFSPVAKAITVRLFLALAAAFDWHIYQFDVNNAFFHGYLDEEIFMEALEGYQVPEGHVCRLKRSLYGLKQASRQWNQEFTTQIASYGFVQSKNDYCLFTKTSDTSLQNARTATTPLPPGIKFAADAGAHLANPKTYRRLVGRLLYLNFTRPDTSYAAEQLSQFLQHPCQQHWDAALHLVRYLKGSMHKGLFFPSTNSLKLKAFSDADWASCVDTRRSLTGYCIFLGTALVSWKTEKQNTVSRSTAEAEYRSMGSTICELSWIMFLLQDFGVLVQTPVPFLCDNQAALHIVANPVFHERTKHLEIDCHIVRDKFKSGLIALAHVPSKEQLADIFTKSLAAPSFLTLISKLGLVEVPFNPRPTCGGADEVNHASSSEHAATDMCKLFFPAIT
ncbi:UNVERIFIED_CONTAM: Retrovirus-related Pol polyprotein from transposon TNT 1-94 [Sesamum radiatum]|uniref:Retrovirus-related Pol polyprotein from transposon TNT 1-94 n=1 Tax=Sesamum radiatum TaxID=300843 RepID=A0AAW2PZV5_SESRA